MRSRRGTCCVCGCTSQKPCTYGITACWWVNAQHTLCSTCYFLARLEIWRTKLLCVLPPNSEITRIVFAEIGDCARLLLHHTGVEVLQ
jgi:hypothetical protein